MKYKAGDKVKIKSLEWYNNNKDEDGYVDSYMCLFTPNMVNLCGKTVTIIFAEQDHFDHYIVSDTIYKITDEMIECLVEESEVEAIQEEAQNEHQDKVNCPSHYKWFKDMFGVEPADIAQEFPYNIGTAMVYMMRAGHKKEEGYTMIEKQIEDYKKAIWHIKKDVERLKKINKK